ncbi:MAG: alpha/beta hydrolase [Clostridia bacterium]|nr:alpha/beta hydrolase [Clostridia bacterium]
MKKVLALALSIIMIFAAAIPAFAAYETPFEDSRFFEYGEYSIHYRKWDAENPKGQIFMIHGFALSSYCWTKLAERLVANGYTCVMADLPDFGYSTRETAGMEKLLREDIMHALMTELSSEPWYLAGHSMGGFVAESIYDKYPESVNNLLLYGTSGNITSPSMAKIMGNDIFVALVGPLMQLMTRFDFLVKMFLRVALADNDYAADYDISKITEPLRINGTGKGACYNFSMLTGTNFESIKNGSPILYVNGSEDSVISSSAQDEFREYLPEGSVDYIVDGGGHMFIENKADEVAEVTLKFLAEN